MTPRFSIWPLRFSADPAAMITFFASLGMHRTVSRPSKTYATFVGSSGRLGVHDVATASAVAAGRTTLNLLTADVPAAADAIRGRGLQVRVWAEPDGQQGAITAPSGLIIGLNEASDGGPGAAEEFLDQTVAASMGVVAICSVSDVDREAEFFAGFGFEAIEPADGYLPLTAGPGSGVIGLRASTGKSPSVPPGSPYLVDVGAETSEPFDALAGRLQADGYAATTVEDDSGLWVRVTDPDREPLEVRPTR